MNVVKHTRLKLGLTQPQFAEIVRYDVSTISRIEGGKQKSAQILISFCRVLSQYYDRMAMLTHFMTGQTMDSEAFLREIREALELDNAN